eukprot:7976075-Alexandrium_andersonii.AAC.1
MLAPRRRASCVASSPCRCQEATFAKQAPMTHPCAPAAREAGRPSMPGSWAAVTQCCSGWGVWSSPLLSL